MTAKQSRETRQIEMVETHNLALSFTRLRNAPGLDRERWKRALIHALAMSNTPDSYEMSTAIRTALRLP